MIILKTNGDFYHHLFIVFLLRCHVHAKSIKKPPQIAEALNKLV